MANEENIRGGFELFVIVSLLKSMFFHNLSDLAGQ